MLLKTCNQSRVGGSYEVIIVGWSPVHQMLTVVDTVAAGKLGKYDMKDCTTIITRPNKP